MPDASATPPPGFPRNHLLALIAFEAVALAGFGWISRHALNPDGISYLRIATYYAAGNTHLAVNGYWGPLLSWLMAPALMLGLPPLVAARAVMAVSAAAFVWSCFVLFRRFGLSGRLLLWGVWAAAVVSIPWSVENITPDLLLGALTNFAFASMAGSRWLEKSWVPFAGGLCWGVAYLCKSVALPLGVLTVSALALGQWWKNPASLPRVMRGLGLALLAMVLVSAPWIAINSAKYGALTVSRSARYNHTLVGPGVARPVYLLDEGFHWPETGRITTWEDPSMPDADWSVFDSWDNVLHQAHIITHNVPVALKQLSRINALFLPLALYALWLVAARCGTSGLPGCGQAAIPIAALALLYLPNYLLSQEQRYYYPTFAPFFVVGAGLLCRMGPGSLPQALQRSGAALLAAALLLPAFWVFSKQAVPARAASECAWVVAEQIRVHQFSGPVAGSGRVFGNRTAPTVAFLLDQPWVGDQPSAGPSDYQGSGASLIIVTRDTEAANELSGASGFKYLNPELFPLADEAAQFPLQAFQCLSPTPAPIEQGASH